MSRIVYGTSQEEPTTPAADSVAAEQQPDTTRTTSEKDGDNA
ncbi:hypothetical protein [Pseudarthrobacter sp. BIM B-2242]|nr:hypothetical protein [Pseudarthrobacter sp. BIM B-2242]